MKKLNKDNIVSKPNIPTWRMCNYCTNYFIVKYKEQTRCSQCQKELLEGWVTS